MRTFGFKNSSICLFCFSLFKDDGLHLRMQSAKSIFTLFLQQHLPPRKPQLSWAEILRNERLWLSKTKQIFCCSLCYGNVTVNRLFSKVSELPSDGWHELFEPSIWCHASHNGGKNSITEIRLAPKASDAPFLYLSKRIWTPNCFQR